MKNRSKKVDKAERIAEMNKFILNPDGTPKLLRGDRDTSPWYEWHEPVKDTPVDDPYSLEGK